MASFHSHTQVISRSGGRSSVAAAAYRSGQKLTNGRDGIVHDYSRKHGIVHCEIVLPEHAPARWLDRETLWNEVEAAEKQANAQLAREINYALPVELTRDEQIAHAREYARYFAEMGMVADIAVHDTGDGNPHVHMMLTMRPCNDGGFTAKSKSSYLVRNVQGEERMADAEEFKQLKEQGFEKVYTYRLGSEYRKLTPTQAQSWDGCKRVGKNPEKEKVAMAAWLDYRDETQLETWRGKLAEIQNRFLAEAGHSARVDHRSYEAQGIEKIPQIHEGPQVKSMERKAEREARRQGIEYRPVTALRRENTAIAKANAVLERAMEAAAALVVQIKGTAIAGKLTHDMSQWRQGMERAAQRLFQPRQVASKAVSEQMQATYREQTQSRLTAYRERLMQPSYRAKGRIDSETSRRALTKRERSFLTPEQDARYRRQREAEEQAENNVLKTLGSGYGSSSSRRSASRGAPAQSRGMSR